MKNICEMKNVNLRIFFSDAARFFFKKKAVKRLLTNLVFWSAVSPGSYWIELSVTLQALGHVYGMTMPTEEATACIAKLFCPSDTLSSTFNVADSDIYKILGGKEPVALQILLNSQF